MTGEGYHEIDGRIVAYLPPGDDEEDFAMWKNEHHDGEMEDLEEHEVEDAIHAYQKQLARPATQYGGDKNLLGKRKGEQDADCPNGHRLKVLKVWPAAAGRGECTLCGRPIRPNRADCDNEAAPLYSCKPCGYLLCCNCISVVTSSSSPSSTSPAPTVPGPASASTAASTPASTSAATPASDRRDKWQRSGGADASGGRSSNAHLGVDGKGGEEGVGGLCKMFFGGGCSKGRKCPFSHSKQQVRLHSDGVAGQPAEVSGRKRKPGADANGSAREKKRCPPAAESGIPAAVAATTEGHSEGRTGKCRGTAAATGTNEDLKAMSKPELEMLVRRLRRELDKRTLRLVRSIDL